MNRFSTKKSTWDHKTIDNTEFPIPSVIEIFRLSFREYLRLVGRYCS